MEATRRTLTVVPDGKGVVEVGIAGASAPLGENKTQVVPKSCGDWIVKLKEATALFPACK